MIKNKNILQQQQQCIEVREIDETHGFGTFALQSFTAGDFILQETPIVFQQSLISQYNKTGTQCCLNCGMIIAELEEECKRLSYLAQLALKEEKEKEYLIISSNNNNTSLGNEGKSDEEEEASSLKVKEEENMFSSNLLYETLKEFKTSTFFCKGVGIYDNNNNNKIQSSETLNTSKVQFCSIECRKRYLYERGGRFLILISNKLSDDSDNNNNNIFKKPSVKTIMHYAIKLDIEMLDKIWPNKSDIIETLEYLSNTYNERLRLILSLLARCLNDTFNLTNNKSLEEVQLYFNKTVENLVSNYAEGSPRVLTEQHRYFFRFSWKCICHWLTLCYKEELNIKCNVESFTWISLQLFLRCFWCSDANVHMYVVVSPLYTLLCQKLPTLYAICHQNNNNNKENEEDNNSWLNKRIKKQIHILKTLFQLIEPSLAHATGVALYNIATKINHSCTPSVKFIPTHGGVKAIIIALRDIKKGEEIRTSYIDMSEYPLRETRQEYLRTHYGFICDCALCSL